jgi:hypothetical protein
MKSAGFAIGIVLLLATVGVVWAQQQPPLGIPQQPGGVVGTPIRPQGPSAPAAAYGPLLSLLQRPATAAQSGEPGYPMFQLVGPENRASFWADPEAAGNALVLQGELMMKMGEVMVKQGRELVDKAKKRPE